MYTRPLSAPDPIFKCQQTANGAKGCFAKFLKPVPSGYIKYPAPTFSCRSFRVPFLPSSLLNAQPPEMKKYHTFPKCMDVIINDSDGSSPLVSAKVLHHSASFYSNFSFPSWWPVDESHMYAFAEAASSPAKYSTFQFLGCKAMQHFGSSTTLFSSACVGAVGGTVLTLVYFALLLAKKDQIHTESTAILSLSSYALLLSKEMSFSAVAAVIGALAKGMYSPPTLSTHVIAGVLGPIIFLLLLFGGLGLVILVVWVIEKFRDWYSGY